MIDKISLTVNRLKGVISEEGVNAETTPDALFLKFSLVGSNKVDVAYKLEQIVMQQRLDGLTADITRSRVLHRVHIPEGKAMEHREIVSQSPVSMLAPYHTALIVVAAASAFVICVLLLLVILYRRKMNSLGQNKVVDNVTFLPNNRPIYIELPNEKFSSLDK